MTRKLFIHNPLNCSFDEALRRVANEQKPNELHSVAKPFVKWAAGKDCQRIK
jgi:hypothetical protein